MIATGDAVGRQGSRAFVGRDWEVAELVAGLEDAVGGRGRLFLIAGEPGIGKTWLADHVAGRAMQRGIRVLWGRCWEGGGAPPFWPWAQIIGALAEACDDAALSAYLGAGAGSAVQLVPGLGERLGNTAVCAVPLVESDAARFYLFDAVTGFFNRAASEQPLLLVLDDLHAADEASLLLLQFLARDLRDCRLLVVGTYRDVGASPSQALGNALGQLVREGQLLNLRGLGRGDVKSLIETLSGVAPSEAQAAAVHQKTEGNPLFVREAMRLLATPATLEGTGGLCMPIPGSVRAVIQRRFAPLSAEAVQVLSVAAVVGREFDVALVRSTCDLAAELVLGALSEAMAMGVVAGERGAVGRYRFSHSLMREVLYEQLPIPVRVQLHRRVGEAMERAYGTGSGVHFAELARHFAEAAVAGKSAKALAYAHQAGERAMDMHAYEEAAAEYQRALSFARPDDPYRCELLLRLGAAQARAGSYREAEESCLQAAELSRTTGAPEQLARAALCFGERQVEGGQINRRLVALLQEALDGLNAGDSSLRARLLARLALEFTFSDETERIESLSLEAVEMARRLADPAALRTALGARWMAVWGPDGLDERAALAAEILRVAWQTGDREMELDGLASRAANSLESGDINAARADVAAHARLAEELPMAVHRWAAMTMRAMQALLDGSFQEAERLAEEALSQQPGRPNVMFTHIDQVALLRWEQGRLGEVRDEWQGVADHYPRAAFARAWLALADVERGADDDARRELRYLVEELPQRPRNGIWLPAVALTSVVAAHLNETEAAGSLYPVLLPYAGGHVISFTAPQPVVCLGSASFYLGLLATVRSRWAEAAGHFQAAIGVHDRLGARSFLARTRYEYARMLRRRGQASDRTKSVVLLDRALATANALGMATIAAGIRELRAAETGGTVHTERAAEAAAAGFSGNVFRREGQYWTVCYEGSVVRVKDAKGLRYLSRLLVDPGREFHVADLEAADRQAERPAPSGSLAGVAELHTRPDLGDAGELLDARAKAEYKARLDELQAELDEAERFNDPTRADRAQAERDFLVHELARAVGLGGRDRKAASHAERARLNVTRAIHAAMANLGRANPSLGQHLSATIRTGRYCSYTPDPRAPIRWEL
jgi:predicted ATPase